MKQMKGIFFLLGIFLAVSCGKKTTSTSKPGVYINNLNRTPISLFKEYGSCEGAEASAADSYYYLIQFLQGGQYGRELNMQSSLSGAQLRGFQIEQTYYDAEMMLLKTVRGGRLVGLEFLVTNDPKPMSICPGVKSYQRYSYENASLSATYSIGKTAEKLREVNFSAGKGVKVYVSPYTIERRVVETSDRIVREDLRLTDNAFYFPHLRAVVFMPQSEESRDGAGFGNVPLWEVPMVGSHEYGHHVFHSIMRSASAELADHHHSCFKAHDELDGSTVNSIREVGVGDVLASLNEGFADLISYYTLDEWESGLRGVVCMETNRDVDSPVFANRESKLFNDNVMDSFLSTTPDMTAGCYDPNFQQIHTVGAVFANVSERLMSSLGLSKKQKLAIILKWIEDLNKIHPRLSGKGAEQYLVKTYSLLAARAMEASQAVPTQKCDYVEYFFPDSDLREGELAQLGCR